MMNAAEMGSDAMTYIPSFIKTGSGIHKLTQERVGVHRHTDSMKIAKPTLGQ
jgi:hypothetical protein